MGYQHIGGFPGEIGTPPQRLAHSRLVGNDAPDAHPQYNEGYRLKETLYFTSSGTFSKADYPGLRAVRAMAQGGGGGGAGGLVTNGSECSGASGGSGAGYGEAFVLVDDLSASETVTVGAGGTGTTAASGNAGGNSSFGSHCSGTGGGGGASTRTTGTAGAGGPAGASGSGDLVIRGGDAGSRFVNGTANWAKGGEGGGAHLGMVTPGGVAFGAGGVSANTAGGYGSGGNGAATTHSQAARAGASGADGIVIVELYF